MGGGVGCLCASHEHSSVFLAQCNRKCYSDMGLGGCMAKTSSRCKFYSFVLDTSLGSLSPFFLSIFKANLAGMAVISGSQHCLFYQWLLCCF